MDEEKILKKLKKLAKFVLQLNILFLFLCIYVITNFCIANHVKDKSCGKDKPVKHVYKLCFYYFSGYYELDIFL